MGKCYEVKYENLNWYPEDYFAYYLYWDENGVDEEEVIRMINKLINTVYRSKEKAVKDIERVAEAIKNRLEAKYHCEYGIFENDEIFIDDVTEDGKTLTYKEVNIRILCAEPYFVTDERGIDASAISIKTRTMEFNEEEE